MQSIYSNYTSYSRKLHFDAEYLQYLHFLP